MEEWNLWGTTAPCVVAQLVRCGGGGGARHRRPAPRWVDVTKAYQTRCYGFVPPFYSPFGHDQAYNRVSGQMSTKPTWRRLAPLVLGLGRRLGGGAAPRSFDHQIRAHGQIHRHVSFMNASGVQIIGGKLQVSRPAWCPPPPLTLLVAPQAPRTRVPPFRAAPLALLASLSLPPPCGLDSCAPAPSICCSLLLHLPSR